MQGARNPESRRTWMYAATTKDEGNAQMGVFEQPANKKTFQRAGLSVGMHEIYDMLLGSG